MEKKVRFREWLSLALLGLAFIGIQIIGIELNSERVRAETYKHALENSIKSNTYCNLISAHKDTLIMKQKRLIELYEIELDTLQERLTVTTYHPVAEQCNSEYWRTASYKKIDTLNPLKHRWIAVSRDLEKKGFVFGAKVKIEGIGDYSGEWEVQDRMNKRWNNRIDLLIGEDNPIGKWENVKVTLK